MSLHSCPSCGTPAEPDARFCGGCGARIEPQAPATTKTPAFVIPPSAAAGSAAKTVMSEAPMHVPQAAATTVISAPGFPTPAPRPFPQPAPTPAPIPLTPPPVVSQTSGLGHHLGPDRLIGRNLNNRYLVQRKIGEGGFGAVFQGKQIATGREVALKILHPHNVADATVVARFRREAEACSKLHNPHTVTIYDFDETEDGTLYLAMELLTGKSLQQLQRSDGPMEPRRVLRILDQVADALGEAHEQGIVHRDMKPENVMVDRRGDEDFVKVLDFGIAKIVSGYGDAKAPALTAIGQTVGTLEFMSPEQLRGRPLDGRSDIYALGMMAYEMLTGILPFHGAKSSTDVIQFHLQKPAPAPSKMTTEGKIPAAVDAVVLKMVRKPREERHANAAELREHIAQALSATDGGAIRKEIVRVVAVVGGLALLVAAIIFLSR